MSIINQVLRDLENRKKPESNNNNGAMPPAAGGLPPSGGDDKNKKPKRLLFILLLLILIVSAGYWWISISKKNARINQHLSKITAQQTKIVEEAQNVIRKINMPIKLKQASFSQLENTGVLTLYFDRRPYFHFSFSSDSGPASGSENDAGDDASSPQNILIITLDKSITDKSIRLGENDFIKKVNTQKDDKNIVLKLQLSPDVKLSGVSPDQNNLVFTLTKKEINPTSSSDMNNLPSQESDQEVEGNNAIENLAQELETKNQKVATLSPEQMREQSYQEALDLSHNGKQAAAVVILKKILLIAPESHDARQTLATIYLQRGEIQQALDLLNAGLNNTPKDIAFIQLSARALLSQGKPEQALELMQTISPAIQTAPDFYALLAVVQQRLGDFMFAAEIYQQLVSAYPGKGTWWVGLGISLQTVGQNNAAVQAYKQGISTKNLTPNMMAFAKTQVIELGG